jgi:hypothetical protein
MAWKRSRVRISPGPPKVFTHELARLQANAYRFFEHGLVPGSPFGCDVFGKLDVGDGQPNRYRAGGIGLCAFQQRFENVRIRSRCARPGRMNQRTVLQRPFEFSLSLPTTLGACVPVNVPPAQAVTVPRRWAPQAFLQPPLFESRGSPCEGSRLLYDPQGRRREILDKRVVDRKLIIEHRRRTVGSSQAEAHHSLRVNRKRRGKTGQRSGSHGR